jgi:hypothetical protein
MSRSMVLIAALAMSGCASWFLHGARMADANTSVAGATAVFDVAACVNSTSGQPEGSPGARYYLLNGQGGPELFERSNDGTGAVITNRWQDERGMHFFTWVGGTGWEYLLGADGSAIRLVYQGFNGQTFPDGTYRPVTQHMATCQMSRAAS